jgi:hypothetical protein
MKIKVLLTGLVVAGLALSSAVAAPPEGKPDKTGDNCKPKVAVVLKGTLEGTPGASATALNVDVTSGNRWGRAYVEGTGLTSVAVDPDTTKVRRQGKKTLEALLDGDRVLVQARVCKAELAESAKPPLTASKVIAHPAKATEEEDD